MRLARLRVGTDAHVIALAGEGAGHDLTATRGLHTLGAALSTPWRVEELGAATAFEAARLLKPLDDDARILCAGFNYRDHAAESDRSREGAHPTFFVRFASSLVGPCDPIERPRASTWLDWEGELAVVIGRGGRAIPRERALDHVGGYCAFGDHSVRDFQLHGTQATAGKNFDRSGAVGPWIVTPDEIADLADLRLETRVGGEVMQTGRLADLIFDVPALIAYASTFMALRPGDVIATGTPAGIGGRRDPPRWLQPGETVEVDIPGVGLLANEVIEEAAA